MLNLGKTPHNPRAPWQPRRRDSWRWSSGRTRTLVKEAQSGSTKTGRRPSIHSPFICQMDGFMV
ncbi:hypothetical protein C2845_PM13G22360 [Panicum miliaceum]|uniref:Uncharacterized protein n=1 Tax=Panicum miliaceum TaxID=4540 RepID=A0A3L6RFE6_PANMI|nr:hypothetical protein C2845_PM13G22360 [Panicum miliaceum]